MPTKTRARAPWRVLALDPRKRCYVEVKARAGISRHLVEDYPALECADCSAPIRHGIDRYFERGTTPEQVVEPVCGACGDRQIDQ